MARGDPDGARRSSSPLALSPRARAPFLVAGILALVAGTLGGLLRLDWVLPSFTADLALRHGPLMIGGFLGTVISLERAVALGGYAYLSPALAALGTAALVFGPTAWAAGAAPLLYVGASAALLAVFAQIARRDPALHAAVMSAGVAAWLAGNLLWSAGWPLDRVVPWWAAYLVLMIAGERLELTRVFPLSPARRQAFLAAAVLLFAGVALSAVDTGADAGIRIAGAGMVALAAWLGRNDVARRTVREHGLTRFMAVCLLAGYAWLGVAGALWVAFGAVRAGVLYDAGLHALFLGFVFGMIFAHAPVIFPSVLGLRMVFRPAFYAHLALLELSLAVRIAGDLAASPPLRQWGGLANALAILLFLLNTGRALAKGGAG